MGAAVAPPAGFNSTMQFLKRQLNKIAVLVEFVIYGGLRTPWVYRSGYALIVRFYRNQRVCLCTHTLVFSYRIGTAHGAPLFARPLPSATSKKAESTDQRAASASGNEVLPPSFMKKYREA